MIELTSAKCDAFMEGYDDVKISTLRIEPHWYVWSETVTGITAATRQAAITAEANEKGGEG